MKRHIFLTVVAAALSLCAEEQILPRASPVVDLGYAKYAGSYNATDGVTRFLGIRYSASPTGELRWKEPQTPAYTPGLQKADAYGNVCYWSSSGAASNASTSQKVVSQSNIALRAEGPSESEDCLFLNVWSPAGVYSHQSLPVIFWIHGGGYISGDATLYDGNDILNIANNKVVVVTIQYRLGLFGFLPGTMVKKYGAPNAGLLDQQFALQWVQKHIYKFGGNPERVTIWGESAGAGSVLQHVVANGGKTSPQLFQTAITSSSFLPSQYAYNDIIPESLYNEAITQTSCNKASNTLECLRKVDIDLLQATNLNISASGFYGTFVFAPVVDGSLIQQRPTEALRQRKVNGKAFLAVTNSNEGFIFVDPNTPADVDAANYAKDLFPTLSDVQVKAVAEQYQDAGNYQSQFASIMGESIFVCPSYYLLNAFDGKAYKGEFAIPPGGHGQDGNYYWTSVSLPSYPAPNLTSPAFTKAFGQIFVDFAISNDPNVKLDSTITPTWKQWEGETEMIFNRTEAGEPDIHAIKTSSDLLSRCRFWESVGAATGQ